MRMLRAGVSGYLTKDRTPEEPNQGSDEAAPRREVPQRFSGGEARLELGEPGKVPYESLFDCEEVREFFFAFVNARIQPCDCLTFAACRPSARRVFFGKCFSVCFRFATLAAFFIFFRAAVRCFPLIIEPPCT